MKNGLIIDANGSKNWYVNDKRHRTDGPAVELPSGSKFWFIDGKHHRTDGPAIVYADGTKCWYVDSKRHRTNKSFQQAAKLTDAEMAALVLKYGDIR